MSEDVFWVAIKTIVDVRSDRHHTVWNSGIVRLFRRQTDLVHLSSVHSWIIGSLNEIASIGGVLIGAHAFCCYGRYVRIASNNIFVIFRLLWLVVWLFWMWVLQRLDDRNSIIVIEPLVCLFCGTNIGGLTHNHHISVFVSTLFIFVFRYTDRVIAIILIPTHVAWRMLSLGFMNEKFIVAFLGATIHSLIAIIHWLFQMCLCIKLLDKERLYHNAVKRTVKVDIALNKPRIVMLLSLKREKTSARHNKWDAKSSL